MGATNGSKTVEKTVQDIMTTEVVTLSVQDSLRLAYDMLSVARVRFFPVLESGKVIGVVSWADLMRASLSAGQGEGDRSIRELLSGVSVREIPMAPPTTVSPGTTSREAARLMLQKHLECLVVLERDAVVGIVTKTDFLREFVKEPSP